MCKSDQIKKFLYHQLWGLFLCLHALLFEKGRCQVLVLHPKLHALPDQPVGTRFSQLPNMHVTRGEGLKRLSLSRKQEVGRCEVATDMVNKQIKSAGYRTTLVHTSNAKTRRSIL